MLGEAGLVWSEVESVETKDAIKNLLFDICARPNYRLGAVILNSEHGPQIVAASGGSLDATVNVGSELSGLIHSGECAEAIQAREIIVIEDPVSKLQVAGWCEPLNPEDIQTLVCIPLANSDRRLGACLLWTGMDKQTHLRDLKALERAGELLSSAVASGQRIVELERMLAQFRGQGIELDQANVRRELSEDTLRASELKYRTLVEASPTCIKLIDNDGRLLSMSRAGLNMLGVADEKDVIGRHYMKAVCEEDQDRIAPFLEAALQGEVTKFDFRAAAGPYFRASLVPIKNADGKVHRLLGVTEDITTQKEAEAARHKLDQRTRHAQKMEAIGQLAGGVAHDFNNFLTIILANSEVLLGLSRKSSELGQNVVEGLSQIHAAGTKAAVVTKQLLTFSRRDHADPELVDVVVAATEMQSLLQHLISDNCVLELETCAGSAVVLADRGQVDQVILNLVNNAADAMPNGGRIRIVVSLATLANDDVTCKPNLESGRYVALCVTDDGHGIEGEHLSHIFEPFFTTNPQKGTGLGLSTVYGAVTRSGGSIVVKTEVGQGSTFSVYFPRVEGASTGDGDGDPNSEAHVDTKKTVLVCEDNEAVRRVTSSALRGDGYVVLEASSGSEALSVAESNVSIDFLVTDVDMPEMTGPELSDALRIRYPGLPVLFISGHAPELLSRATTDTSVYFLPKPFGPKLLLERVSKMLAGSLFN